MTTVEAPPPPVDEAKPAHVICRTDGSGDTSVEWNPDNDAEVEAAQAFFDELKAKKYLAYRVDDGGNTTEVVKEFDPSAAKIVMSPQLVGG